MNELRNKIHAENQILIIFGVNGDLSKRKLLPALLHLYVDGLLPDKFAVDRKSVV